MAGDAARRDDRSQERFLRLFLASERELLRYVAAVAPNADDAREIVQDTAVALWEKFDQYDASRPFTPWACRFALNISKQWLARQKRWRAILSDDLAGHLVRRRMELEADIDHRLRHLQGCLEKLPAPQRQLVDGYYSRQIGIDGLAAETRRSWPALEILIQSV
jgi:RNA polymerase sigma-70 factor (ECF subfamily)